jgi:hypothetical protein
MQAMALIEQTIAGNFVRQPREFHQHRRARRRIAPLHEGCRHAASLRRQSWHRPALPAGSQRYSSRCRKPAVAFAHRGVRPHRPAGAYDVPPPQIISRIFSRGLPPAAIAARHPACHRRTAARERPLNGPEPFPFRCNRNGALLRWKRASSSAPRRDSRPASVHRLFGL